VVVQGVFTEALGLQGASAADGVVRVSGQTVILEVVRLGPGQSLRLQVDAYVRSDVPAGAVLMQQGTAKQEGEETILSNVVEVEVVGAGTGVTHEPTAPGIEATTPGVQPTIAGGPEAPPPLIPTTAPGDLGSEIPYTGAGLPVAGVVLGGVVLVSRQLRLRWAGRRRQDD
jgi:hypothetical protein